jgi:mannosyltransferase OCH1-like enzyme
MKVHVTVIIVLIIAYMFFSLKSKSNYEEVPKIIHQTAMSDKSKWNPIWERCQQSWKDKFPDFEYRMWTDEDLENLVKTDFSWFYDTWKGYDKNIKRIDSARYCILYKHGGMYVDMDFECLENFWDQIPMDKVSIAESGQATLSKHENALMISPKEHPFWEFIFSQLFRLKDEDVIVATGPQLIDSAFDQYSINSLKKEDFSLKNGKYSIHHQTGSWNF